jgi:RNA polymerase sigma-70 factor (family 1)
MEFKNLFKEYYPRLVFFAFEIIRDRAGAEDLVQDAFVTYWKGRSEVADHPVAIRNYLYTTVRRAALNVLRHEKVREKFARQQDSAAAEEHTALHALIHSEVLAGLASAIRSLPEGCQRISCMSFLHGMKNEEIARELGVSVNTVKTQKRRALQLLRLRLNPEALALLLLFIEY